MSRAFHWSYSSHLSHPSDLLFPVYQSVLTRRYLFSKLMPMLAIVCVALSSALLLLAWSIMGGFLVMLLEIGRKVEGDVTISWPTVGFAHYDDLIARLEKDPLVAAAAPTIETFGMVTLPDGRAIGVRIKGVDERFAKVSDYAEQIWWKALDERLPKDYKSEDPRLDPNFKRHFSKAYENALNLRKFNPETGTEVPALVPGIETTGFTIRNKEGKGFYQPAGVVGRRDEKGALVFDVSGMLMLHSLTVRVIPMDSKGRDMATFVTRTLPVANEYRTGLYENDKNVMLMNLAELQRMLKMEEAERVQEAPRDPYAVIGSGASEQTAQRRVIGVSPARVTTVLVKAADGVNAEKLLARVEEIYGAFAAAHDDVPALEMMKDKTISTWERGLTTFISAVKKETAIVVGMLLFMSVVYAVLILSIFWAMVSEKTKDIGILRAVGAGRSGVAWLWLSYGMIIGIVGGLLGLLLGTTIVWNINPIHDWLGTQMGINIWDPSVYYFPTIPNKVDEWKAALVVVSTVFFCTLGALIPALRAAYMDPVRALRFE